MAPHADGDVRVEAITDTSAAVMPDPVLTKNPTQTRFTIDDVLPHRQKSSPMPMGVAPFGSADMFKSKACASKPKAKNMLHHISAESASRKPSSLKGAMKHFTPEMISLCGGLPSSDYFPFESLSARVPAPPGFSEPDTAVSGQEVTMRKHDVKEGTSQMDLSIVLNYGQSMGPPQLMRFLVEHNEIVHNPRYGDWDVVLTSGSTAALDTSLRLFCSRGDFVLTEEYSFSSAIETMLPMGLTPVGVAMDDQGMLPSSLDSILTNWDPTRGRKPHVLYFVPTGQNPSGATQPLQRRKEVYAVAEKHDIILLEDEPYYFLQMAPYASGKVHEVPHPFKPSTPAEFLPTLIPSYLSIDTSGRVVRMDSMSKTLAPGSRVGWVTTSKHICERYIRAQEVSSQTPSGFATAVLYKLLEEAWGHKGFLEWLMYLRTEYTRRRDIMLNACEKHLPTSVANWKVPTAGMFHWIEVRAEDHPGVKAGTVSLKEVEEKVFLAGVAANVLVAKGSWFWAEKDNKVVVGTPKKEGSLFFRMTFAAASEELIVEAVKRFGAALRAEFKIKE